MVKQQEQHVVVHCINALSVDYQVVKMFVMDKSVITILPKIQVELVETVALI
ncbi:hypothetical protein TEGAF0_19630 [Sediminibacterium sp. TEGAF015]|nr:hypothetical protein TEGAF0_19630 [Sediminibacterium sp. TEGAF015]